GGPAAAPPRGRAPPWGRGRRCNLPRVPRRSPDRLPAEQLLRPDEWPIDRGGPPPRAPACRTRMALLALSGLETRAGLAHVLPQPADGGHQRLARRAPPCFPSCPWQQNPPQRHPPPASPP